MSSDRDTQVRQLQEQLRLERQRREQAESRTQPTTLSEYLRGCHDGPYRAFSVQQDKSLTSKGSVTKPEGRFCPLYLRSWTDFPDRQQEVFDQLPLTEDASSTSRVFPSLQYLMELGRDQALRKTASEKDLEIFERATLENPIAHIIRYLYSQAQSRETFGLSSEIEFETHANALSAQGEKVSERPASSQPSTPIGPSSSFIPLHADQICIYKATDGRRIPLLIVEYKPPHKLTLPDPDLRLGLREMNLKEEVVDRVTKPAKSDEIAWFQYYADRVIATVVTQVYSYMIKSGIEYSYITTGEAFVFLQVRADQPDTTYYHLADPTAEVAEAARLGEDYLLYTAVGQVLAFCLMAFQSKPRHQKWRNAAMKNSYRWAVDDLAVLHEIPDAVIKQGRSPSAFVPRTYHKDLRSSPVKTRSQTVPSMRGCSDDQNKIQDPDHSSTDSGEEGHPTSPTQRKCKSKQPSLRCAAQKKNDESAQEYGQTRTYCTQLCLRGLKTKGVLDFGCPNLALHQQNGNYRHHQLDQARFCSLLREQLDEDLDNDCEPLGIQGSRGALFKVTLSDYGYTIAAKGTVSAFVPVLQHEAAIYGHLERHQGRIVPACLGGIDLIHPYYYDFGVKIVHMLLLGWGGDCLVDIDDERIECSLQIIHGAGVLHGDVRKANMLWNDEANCVMFIDFERAVLWDEPPSPIDPLCPVSPNIRERALASQEKLLRYRYVSQSLADEIFIMRKTIQ